jgi:Patatin-like phospholipase
VSELAAEARPCHGAPKGVSGPCQRSAVGVRHVNDVTATSTTTFERERDRHLFGPGPKRLLALDGGGVRGAITVAFLERIETVLRERLGLKEVHLGDWFDLVGGTSTGSIIAGALALGYSASDIRRFYDELAPRVFRRNFWRIQGLRAKFDATALRAEIAKIVQELSLDAEELITGFCLVTKRMDTGSPWILANNPRAP